MQDECSNHYTMLSYTTTIRKVVTVFAVVLQKSISALFFIGGWTMTAYVAQFLYQNFIELSETYKLCLAGYCVTVGALSCAYCYYKGPIENVRTHNIIAAFIRVRYLFKPCKVFIPCKYSAEVRLIEKT